MQEAKRVKIVVIPLIKFEERFFKYRQLHEFEVSKIIVIDQGFLMTCGFCKQLVLFNYCFLIYGFNR